MNHSLPLILTTATAIAAMPSHAQTPKLGVNTTQEVVDAMTLDEKLDPLIGTGGNVATNATATIGSSSELVPGAAGQLNPIPRLGIPATVLVHSVGEAMGDEVKHYG